jgi:hypothetical protein
MIHKKFKIRKKISCGLAINFFLTVIMSKAESVCVVVRCRPLNKNERNENMETFTFFFEN